MSEPSGYIKVEDSDGNHTGQQVSEMMPRERAEQLAAEVFPWYLPGDAGVLISLQRRAMVNGYLACHEDYRVGNKPMELDQRTFADPPIGDHGSQRDG